MLQNLVPEITKVEIVKRGRYYAVPCVQVPKSIPTLVGEFRSGDWVPIIGSLHSDPEIGADYQHFHYDRRFCKHKIPAQSVLAFGVLGEKLLWPNAGTIIEWKWRKCYLAFDDAVANVGPSRLIRTLEDLHQKCRLQPNNLCPHRNMPLSGIPADDYGNVICPAHGLRWHKASGELVRY
jgi:hypothetical protein